MKLIIANQKMGLEKSNLEKYIESLKKVDTSHVIICPNNLHMEAFKDFTLGAQNVCGLDTKEITGEVSSSQLADYNVKYCIVGHSERRQKYNETDEDILNKIKKLLANKIIPIFCIGETHEEKEREKTLIILEKQISKIFNNLSIADIKKIVIAYEPIWAIGSGLVCDYKTIEKITIFIKSLVANYYEAKVNVVYGGSINDKNIEKLLEIEDLDGFLVGKSCLDIDKFVDIIKKSR